MSKTKTRAHSQTPQNRQNRLKCPACHDKHHVSQCTFDRGLLMSVLAPHVRYCVICNEITLGGQYCVECVFDRALERIFANVSKNR